MEFIIIQLYNVRGSVLFYMFEWILQIDFPNLICENVLFNLFITFKQIIVL